MKGDTTIFRGLEEVIGVSHYKPKLIFKKIKLFYSNFHTQFQKVTFFKGIIKGEVYDAMDNWVVLKMSIHRV
jgi:hypothetical protein